MSAESTGKTIGAFVRRHPLLSFGGFAVVLVLVLSAKTGGLPPEEGGSRAPSSDVVQAKAQIESLIAKGEKGKALAIAEAQGLTQDSDVQRLLSDEIDRRKLVRAEKAVTEIKKELALYRPAKTLSDFKIGDITKMDVMLGHIQAANHPELNKLRAEFEKQRNSFIELKASAGKWVYHTKNDELTNKNDKLAVVDAEQQLTFDFPYNGGATASIVLRNSPRHGNDVMLQVTKGHFLCSSYDGCNVVASFDGGKPVTFSAIGPSDQSNTVIFIRNYNKFVTSLKRSSKVVIAAEFYQEGTPNMTFRVGGLDWK